MGLGPTSSSSSSRAVALLLAAVVVALVAVFPVAGSAAAARATPATPATVATQEGPPKDHRRQGSAPVRHAARHAWRRMLRGVVAPANRTDAATAAAAAAAAAAEGGSLEQQQQRRRQTGNGQSCADDDEFEPNPGPQWSAADGNVTASVDPLVLGWAGPTDPRAVADLARAAVLGPTLLWDGTWTRGAAAQSASVTGILCSTDPDGGRDAFVFRAAQTNAGAGPALLLVTSYYLDQQVQMRLNVTRVTVEEDPMMAGLVRLRRHEVLGRSSSTFDVESVVSAVSLPLAGDTFDGEGELFLVEMEAYDVGASPATPYRLKVEIADPATACGPNGPAQLAAGETVVSMNPTPANHVLQWFRSTVCGATRFQLPSGIPGPAPAQADELFHVAAVSDYPYLPLVVATELGVSANRGDCCEQVGRSDEDEVDARVDVPQPWSTDYDAFITGEVFAGEVEAGIYAVRCSPGIESSWPNRTVTVAAPADWAATSSASPVQSPPRALCDASFLYFRVDVNVAQFAAGKSLFVRAVSTVGDLRRIGTPQVRVTVYNSGGAALGPPRDSYARRTPNIVEISNVSTDFGSAAYIRVGVVRTSWYDSGIMPPRNGVAVEIYQDDPTIDQCINYTLAPPALGSPTSQVVYTCPGGAPIQMIVPAAALSGQYDMRVTATLLVPGTQVEVQASVPALAGFWDGTGFQELSEEALVRLPYRIFAPFGTAQDVLVQIQSGLGEPVAVNVTVEPVTCTATLGNNNLVWSLYDPAERLTFNGFPELNKAMLPNINEPAAQPGQACSDSVFFRVLVENADIIYVQLRFASVTEGSTNNRDEELVLSLDILDMRVVDAGGTNLWNWVVERERIAYWGRHYAYDMTTLPNPPQGGAIFLEIESSAGADARFDVLVQWRNHSQTFEGGPVQRYDAITTTGTTGTTGFVPTPSPPPPSSVAQNDEGAESSGGDAGVAVAIVLSIVIPLCIIGAVIGFLLFRRRQAQDEAEREEGQGHGTLGTLGGGVLGRGEAHEMAGGPVNTDYGMPGSLTSTPGATDYSPMTGLGTSSGTGTPNGGYDNFDALGGTQPVTPGKGDTDYSSMAATPMGGVHSAGSAGGATTAGQRIVAGAAGGAAALGAPDQWTIAYSELVLEAEIGRGAFGVVFRGRWRASPVAVKQVSEHLLTEHALAEFVSEAKLMMELRPHANVVALLGVCAQPLCLVTEFLALGSLADFLATPDGERITPPQRHQIIVGIARGLLHLHCENIVHRDLAARNVLMTSALEAKISDFGLSRVDEGADNKTVSEVGPLKWMSPENILLRTFSPKSDVWAFGVTLVEVYTRERPYPGMDGLQVAANVSSGALLPDLPANAPPAVTDLMATCWAFRAEDRPSMDTLVPALEAVDPNTC